MSHDFALRAVRSIALALFVAAPTLALAEPISPPRCDAPEQLTHLTHPLPHVAQKLAAGEPITIVAIGSSSTAGAGATAPSFSYPSRLQVELAKEFPRQKFRVLNRGINGEEAKDMLRRFDAAIVAERPDLVLWQLGTNSVLRDHPMNDYGAQIRAGLKTIKSVGADVILVDPQFAPKVITKPDAERMVSLIGATAKGEDVDLFQRFALMRHWHDVDYMGFSTFVSPDGLHMNDWGYDCLAKGISAAISEASTRPVSSASAGNELFR